MEQPARRIEFVGGLYHVGSRGNEQKPVYRDAGKAPVPECLSGGGLARRRYAEFL